MSSFLNEVRRRRTFAIISHPDAGKTTLTEKLLLFSGAIQIAGAVKGRKAGRHATSDWMEIEKQRGISVASSVMQMLYRDHVINLLDTPGEPSFVADALGALRVCESAVFVVNAVMGVEVSTSRLWARAAELDIARMLFVNMLDRERADFFRTLESLKDAFGPHAVATEIPIGAEHTVRGVIDLIDMKAYEYEGEGRDNCR